MEQQQERPEDANYKDELADAKFEDGTLWAMELQTPEERERLEKLAAQIRSEEIPQPLAPNGFSVDAWDSRGPAGTGLDDPEFNASLGDGTVYG